MLRGFACRPAVRETIDSASRSCLLDVRRGWGYLRLRAANPGGTHLAINRRARRQRRQRTGDPPAECTFDSSTLSGRRAERFDDGPGDGLGTVGPAKIHRPGPSFGQHVRHPGIDPPGNALTGRIPAYSPSRNRRSSCGAISVPSSCRTSGRPIAPSRIASAAFARSNTSSDIAEPVSRQTAAPAARCSNSRVKPASPPSVASSTARAASITSGPIPSPGMTAIRHRRLLVICLRRRWWMAHSRRVRLPWRGSSLHAAS